MKTTNLLSSKFPAMGYKCFPTWLMAWQVAEYFCFIWTLVGSTFNDTLDDSITFYKLGDPQMLSHVET